MHFFEVSETSPKSTKNICELLMKCQLKITKIYAIIKSEKAQEVQTNENLNPRTFI